MPKSPTQAALPKVAPAKNLVPVTKQELTQKKCKHYSSNLRKGNWQQIEPLITVARTSKWPLEEVVNGILYQLKNDCLWYDLPGDFPPWRVVLYHFNKWSADGTWQKIEACLLTYYGRRVPQPPKQKKPSGKVIFDLGWIRNRVPAAPTLGRSPTGSA